MRFLQGLRTVLTTILACCLFSGMAFAAPQDTTKGIGKAADREKVFVAVREVAFTGNDKTTEHEVLRLVPELKKTLVNTQRLSRQVQTVNDTGDLKLGTSFAPDGECYRVMVSVEEKKSGQAALNPISLNIDNLRSNLVEEEPKPSKKESSADKNFSVEARFFMPDMDMKVKTDKIHTATGSTLGLKDTLGFDSDNAPELIFRYKRFSLDYFHLEGDGSRNLNAANFVTFDNKSYAGNVSTKSKLDYFKLDMTNPIFSTDTAGLDWTYGLTIMHWEGSVHGRELATGLQGGASESYWIPFPAIGIGGHITLDPKKTFDMYAKISGLPAGGYGYYYDLEAGLRYHPTSSLAITAGYRRIELKASNNKDEGKLTLDGPFVGLSFSF